MQHLQPCCTLESSKGVCLLHPVCMHAPCLPDAAQQAAQQGACNALLSPTAAAPTACSLLQHQQHCCMPCPAGAACHACCMPCPAACHAMLHAMPCCSQCCCMPCPVACHAAECHAMLHAMPCCSQCCCMPGPVAAMPYCMPCPTACHALL